MKLRDYFSGNSGVGVISTSNEEGEVNSAIYAKPHILEDGGVAFIMRDRLTHANLQTNGNANYLFIEHEHGFKGVRLSLTKTGETNDKELINSLSRRTSADDTDSEERFVVSFTVNKALSLVGGDEIELQ